MKLTTRIELLLAVVFAISIGATYAIQRYVVYESFASAERDAAAGDLERCGQALRTEGRHLEKVVKDWAFWDDLYEFMANPADDFIRSNLSAAALATAEIDTVHLLDAEGRVVWSQIAGRRPDLPELPSDRWDLKHPLCVSAGARQSISGIMPTSLGPLIVAGGRILTSEVQGPPRGTLVIGRFLDASRLRDLAIQTSVSFQLFPATPELLSPEHRAVLREVRESSVAFLAPDHGDTSRAFTVHPGTDGAPALLLSATMPRTIEAHGQLAVAIGMTTTAAALLFVLLALGRFLRRTVVRPIQEVREHAAAIGGGSDFSRRLAIARADEVGELANEFNDMLERLEVDRVGRRHAEDALAESRQRMEAVWEATGNALFVIDRESFVILDLNPAAAKMIGMERDALVGRNRKDAIHLAEGFCSEIPSDDYPHASSECTLNREDGIDTPVLRAVIPFTVSDRRYVLECLTDISVQKAAEVAARASEDRLRTVIDSSKDAMIAIDRTGSVTIFNPAAEEMFGRGKSEMLGGALTPLMPKEFRARHQEYVHGYFTTGLPSSAIGKTLELPAVRSDGSAFSMELTLSPGRVDGEEFVLAVVRDITSRKAIEQALRDSESLLRATLESAADGILVVDTGGRITHRNTRFLEIWRIPDELVESTDDERILDFVLTQITDPGAFLAKVRDLSDTHDESVDTITFLDGRVFELHSFPLIHDRELAGRVWNSRDITATIRTQEELRCYAEAQAVLLREVNHRVKNNLSAIIAMVHKEEDRARASGVAEFVPLLTDLVARVRGLATVHEMLSASGWRPLVLADLCDRIVRAALQGLPLHKQVNLDIEGDPSTVTSDDAHHLTLAINELATNTVKHALHGRTTGAIHVRVTGEEDQTHLVYRDDGPGYPDAVLDSDSGSAGVGFDLIRGIVTKNLRGTLRFANDKGAVAHISLEARSEASGAQESMQ
ncbi:MAG: PAS domain S-box protein [bacterium]|nr:PAS domain S-box protein [bacterium]